MTSHPCYIIWRHGNGTHAKQRAQKERERTRNGGNSGMKRNTRSKDAKTKCGLLCCYYKSAHAVGANSKQQAAKPQSSAELPVVREQVGPGDVAPAHAVKSLCACITASFSVRCFAFVLPCLCFALVSFVAFLVFVALPCLLPSTSVVCLVLLLRVFSWFLCLLVSWFLVSMLKSCCHKAN